MKPQNKHCLGCGIKLQTSDSSQIGFTQNLLNDYCQNCFKLNNYGVANDHVHPVILPEFMTNSVVVVITSVLFLDTLFLTNLNRITNNKIVYLINQIDLLPADTNLELLIKNLELKARLLKIAYHDIILMSALNKHDLSNLKDYLLGFKEPNIYLIGIQNSGKTTIFKHLTNNKTALNLKKAALTQEVLIGQLDSKTIYDTPGLFQKGYLHQFYSYDIYKKILPDRTLRPVIYRLNENSSVIIDGLVAIDIIKLTESSLVFYYNQNIVLHRTNVSRTSTLLSQWQNHFKYGFNEYTESVFKLLKPVKYQITTADFGFIHLTGPATVKLVHPKGMHITQMEALFK